MSGSTIAFKEIPSHIERPGEYVEVAPVYDALGILTFPAYQLIIAQKTSAGTATAGTIYAVTRKTQATALFGPGSQAERMAWRTLEATQNVPLDVIAVADAGGATAASGLLAFTGPATANGTYAFRIAGRRYLLGVTSGDTATIMAHGLADLINADPQSPVTAAKDPGSVTANVGITAKNAGLVGNGIEIKVGTDPGDTVPAGAAVTITAMANGATNPSIATAITNISARWYTDIAIPWQDTTNTGLLRAELIRRYNGMVMRDAHAYVAISGTYSACLSALAALNSQFMSSLPCKNPATPAEELTASLMGICADSTLQDPSRQIRGKVLPGIVGPDPADRWIDSEEEQILLGGGSSFHVNRSGQVVVQKVVTTRTATDDGVPDLSWHDIMEPKVATRIRHDWRTYSGLIFPSNKLADDGSTAAEYDVTVCTPSRRKGSWAARHMLYARAGWVENEGAMVKLSTFVRDASDRNRLNERLPYQRIGNVMVIATQLLFEV